MEKGLWRYEANVAEPARLNAASAAAATGVIALLRSLFTQHNTPGLFKSRL